FLQGAFNKVYTVSGSKGTFISRVALPLAPRVKTLSEVTTMSLIRAKTSIPVPQVVAYNAGLNNELKFKWVLVEHINGLLLQERRYELLWLKKGLLVQKMVKFIDELSHLNLTGIGSVY
ncbi:hypothetical protein BU25DRAFT_300937, partial [Macroventuria anomochaeta]